MRGRWIGIVAVLAAGASLSVVPRAEAAASLPWDVVPLQQLPGTSGSVVSDINNHGTSVGSSGTFDPSLPVRWDPDGTVHALPLPEGCSAGRATAIADNGAMAGSVRCDVGDDGDQEGVGAYWPPGGASVVRLEPGMLVNDVASTGVVVGELQVEGPSSTDQRAFAFRSGTPRIDLSDGGSTYSYAVGMTEWGFVVGAVNALPGAPAGTPSSIAVGWYGSQVFPLLRTTKNTWARAVNERGQVVVMTFGTTPGERGYVVSPGGAVTELDHTGLSDFPTGINDNGVVVGQKQLKPWTTPSAIPFNSAGVVYVFGVAIRIDSFVTDAGRAQFTFVHPEDINNSAWIVGNENFQTGSWLVRPPTQ